MKTFYININHENISSNNYYGADNEYADHDVNLVYSQYLKWQNTSTWCLWQDLYN